MIQKLKLIGNMKFGQHKDIYCDVQLNVDVLQEDDWAEPDQNIDPNFYIDGVRVTGELSYDTQPLTYLEKKNHPVKPNILGELIVRDGEESSKLNVLIVEKNGDVAVLPNKINRHFWHFFVVGKPKWDKLHIFPENYRGFNMNRIYSCVNFRGYWPVQVASIVVAADKREAKRLLIQDLRAANITVESERDLELVEIDIQKKGSVILNNGDWQ